MKKCYHILHEAAAMTAYLLPGSTVLPYRGKTPRLGQDVMVASGGQLIGDLEIGARSSIWFNVVVRADVHFITIGTDTNIQDNTTVHVTEGQAPCIIGNKVTVGHNAIVHACTVEDHCLIGMGAIVLDKAVIREG